MVAIHRFGDYELIDLIAQGGMGTVYKARQTSLNRLVALKLISAGKLANPDLVERFKAEAEAAASLSHPNIVPIYEIGEHDGQHYFSMGLIAGPTLRDSLSQSAGRNDKSRDQDVSRPGRYELRRSAQLLTAISRAVHYAHQRGVLHRDIKPGNILLDASGVPHLTDFGLAKLVEKESMLTHMNAIMGTPAYMAPEQACGDPNNITTAVDVYQLGAVLYEMLTGSPPFSGATPVELIRHLVEEDPRRPSVLNPALDRDIETICLKCLEKDPHRRYASAEALADDLERWLRSEPIAARPIGAFERLGKWMRRRPALAALLLLLHLVFGLGLAGVLSQWRRAEMAHRETIQGNAQLGRALSQMESIQLQRAEEYLVDDHRVDALPRWALVLRNNPSNRIAAERLMSTLSHRTWARLACPPLQHSNRITFGMFSPDGTRVVTAAADRTAWVWDAATGRRLAGPFNHAAEISSSAFSFDGRFVVTASKDKTARVWDSGIGEPATPPLQHAGDVSTAQFNPAGSLIFTTSGALGQFWDARTGRKEGTAVDAGSPINDARFSPDGALVALACKDGYAQMWEVTQRVCRLRFKHATGVRTIAWSPDGKCLATASRDHTARILDVESGQEVCKSLQHNAGVGSVEFSPDGGRVVTGSYDLTAQIWNARTGEKIGRSLNHGVVRSALFSPEGLRVVTSSVDKTIRVWDALTGEPLTEPLVQEVSAFFGQFDRQGQHVLTVSNGKAAMIWDITPVVPLRLSTRSLAPLCAGFSPDGTEVVVGANRRDTRAWNVLSAEPLALMAQDSSQDERTSVNDVAISPDGRLVAIAGDSPILEIFSFDTGRVLVSVHAHNESIVAVSFSRDARRLVSASWDGTARVWSALTGQPIAGLVHGARLIGAEFSPGGESVLTVASNSSSMLWDASTGRKRAEFRHEANVNSAHFSPDGRQVVTASIDLTARIWDAHTGTLLGTLSHVTEVYSARFSPDGRRIVTAHRGIDKNLCLWDAHTFQPLTDPFADGRSPEFDRAGSRIIDGGTLAGKNVRLWDARTGLRLSEGLLQGTWCRFSHVSPDGRWMMLANEGSVQIREVAPVPLPVPSWLPELAEALAGQRFNAEGTLETVLASELWEVQQKMGSWVTAQAFPAGRNSAASLPAANQSPGPLSIEPARAGDPAFYARWAKWFLADSSNRTVMPSSPLTLPQYAKSLLAEETPEAAREALRLQPDNLLALAIFGSSCTNEMLADWMTRRATELAPNEFKTWSRRVVLMEKMGRWDEAITAMEYAIRLYNASPLYWVTYGKMLERADRTEEATTAYGKAIHFVNNSKPEEVDLGKDAFQRRINLYERLGRHASARADWFRLHRIPLRSPAAPNHLIDLSSYYNSYLESVGAYLPTLPRGVQTFDNLPFDVRAVVQLWPENPVTAAGIKGMKVEQRCRALHFLHGCGPALPEGTLVANYVVHFMDGKKAEVPVVYGENVSNSVQSKPYETHLTHATVAWVDPVPSDGKGRWCLFHSTWRNPYPELLVTSVDFMLRATKCAPFLVALTVEP